jgi:hypothetical protein
MSRFVGLWLAFGTALDAQPEDKVSSQEKALAKETGEDELEDLRLICPPLTWSLTGWRSLDFASA